MRKSREEKSVTSRNRQFNRPDPGFDSSAGLVGCWMEGGARVARLFLNKKCGGLRLWLDRMVRERGGLLLFSRRFFPTNFLTTFHHDLICYYYYGLRATLSNRVG